MIQAIKGMRGQEQALCKCDKCASEEVVPAGHGKANGGRANWARHLELKNEGQVITRLQASGWGLVKGKLYCPRCEAERKASQPKPTEAVIMAENVTQLRQPTPKQKREIISLLETAYDDDAKRYRGKETDLTIAEAIGGGVMFGWVAAIREELFGPEGGNDEIEDVKAKLEDFISAATAVEDKLHAQLGRWAKEWEGARLEVKQFKEEVDKARDAYKRLTAIQKSLGPKAVRA